jgi:WD40 repeat protein
VFDAFFCPVIEWTRNTCCRYQDNSLIEAERSGASYRLMIHFSSEWTSTTRFDWGDAPDVHDFYGRESEQLLLEQWVLREHCQVVSMLGMGGIGKSTLAITLMHQVTPAFQVVVFRSVRNAPPCQDLLADCLQALSPLPLPAIPTNIEQRLDLLLECLQKYRCLLILDNLESLLQEHDTQGHYLPGFEEYGVLLHRVAKTEHQSCLLLTSRETPPELEHLEGQQASVRSLRLAGLERGACEQLLEQREASGTEDERARLVALYAGNPLALKIVAETIVDLFSGEIGTFLEQGEAIFSNIRDLLEEQFSRLTVQEQALLFWLAIVREPLAVENLLMLFAFPIDEHLIKETLDALHRHSLVECGRQQETYSLQSVVQQYVVETLIEQSCEQIQSGMLDYLINYALEQANVKEYVRQTQTRLIVAPILLRLRSIYRHTNAVETQLLNLLDQLREPTKVGGNPAAQGYGPTNLIALLRELRGHLRHLDLSHLVIRGAYLQSVEMQDTSLIGSTLCETIFTETFNAVWTVAISSRGQYWAAGSRQGEVRVWCEDGRILHLIWQAHTDNLFFLTFSPDERLLATASWDGTIKLWDLKDGALLWTGEHTDMLRRVVFSPNGHLLASGGEAGIVKLWDVTSGTNVQTLPGQDGTIFSLAWSPDGSLLANSCFDGSIRLWQIQGTLPPACVHVLTGHTHYVQGLAFSPNGASLVSGSWDKTVKVWDVASGRLRQTLTGHTERVRFVAWSPDGRTIASTGFDKTIRLWDAKHGNCLAALHGHADVIYSLAFTPDSNRLLSSSEDCTLRVWDVENGQCVRIMQGYAGSLYDITWSPDGLHLASASTDRSITIWDVAGAIQPRVLHGHHWVVHGVAWSPDGQTLASCGWDNTIRLWDPITGACFQILQDPDYVDTIFQGIVWSPDGHLLASGGYKRGVQTWDMKTRTRCWVGYSHSTRIRSIAWNPDGSQLASCGDDGNICLWRASDGILIERLQKHQSGVMSVAWSPDGKHLASGGSDKGVGELFVWDVNSGEISQSLRGQAGSVFAVTWSKDGKVLISGGSDGSLCWWEVSSGKCLMKRQGHRGTVQSLRVSPDGRLLASSGDDSTIRLWDIESSKLVRTLRRDRPYERLNMTRIKGLTTAQKAILRALGAFEESKTKEGE